MLGPNADPEPKTAEKKLKPRKKKGRVEPVAKPAKTLPSTPIMTQYRETKEKHPDMILLFRIGDFYEAFDEDAETLHKTLGLTLTTRDQTVSMAGFPHHQLEAYLHKLLKAELRVALCDQVEDTTARNRREVSCAIVPSEEDVYAEETA